MRKTLALVATLAAANAGATFKCVDAQGKTHIGDTPPPACADLPMQELTRGGQVKRTIAPSLTEEQVRQREEAAKKKVEDERRAAEQKRKDDALMQTFSSEKEFDVVRDRNIEPLNRSIRSAQERLNAVDKREKELADELEFYKAGKGKTAKAVEAPRNLLDEQERAKTERAGLQKAIAGYEREIADIHSKFDVDKKRWVAIKSGKNPDQMPTSRPTPVADKSEKAEKSERKK